MSVEASEHYGVALLRQDATGNHLNIVSEFDSETYERYSSAIRNALAPMDRFNFELVEKNFQSYLGVQKYLGRLLSLGREFGSADPKNLGQALMSPIVNWLTSFRLFLDHSEKYLKRTFGENSSQFEMFKVQISTAFDTSPGYRFVYKFRDYVLHRGAPMSKITISREEGNPTRSSQQVVFSLKRDDLLSDKKMGSKVLADLALANEDFELEPLANESMVNLRQIRQVLEDIQIEEGARTIADVREALSLLPADEIGTPNLIRFSFSRDGGLTYSPQPFLTDQSIRNYEAIRDGAKLPSDLRSGPIVPDLPPHDPATIAQRFHQDNRAVQLMTLWHSNGGSSDFLTSTINEMIREDNGIDPIVGGFLNMTAVLTFMTAGVIGVEPTALIGGLLDSYPSSVLDRVGRG